ncbi:MAG: hydrolase [Deferrisomatales bacterium]
MDEYRRVLDWVARQQGTLVDRTARWARVNSGSCNPAGVRAMGKLLEGEFETLGGECGFLPVPDPRRPGGGRPPEVLVVRKRLDAPVRVLLVGHVDTVFGPEHPFQEVTCPQAGVLRGPGVADAKGGLAVALTALEAVERSPWADGLGWQVWGSPDEELGSPGSGGPLTEAAAGFHLGLVFEPGHPDGALVGARKGSGTYTLEVEGRAAHAGRDPDAGRNAIHVLAELIVALLGLQDPEGAVRVNVGTVEGGEAVNVVPARAACRFNVRVTTEDARRRFEAGLERVLEPFRGREGIRVRLAGGFSRPPRPLDPPSEALYRALAACGRELGREIRWRPSGGVSDANLLAAAGLPVADGLGPWGGGIHTGEEHVLVESLTERAQLAALFLLQLAAGDQRWSPPAGGRGPA